jgi:hypothetical protein
MRFTPTAAFAIQATLPQSNLVTSAYTIVNGYFPISPWGGLVVLAAYAARVVISAGLPSRSQLRLRRPPWTMSPFRTAAHQIPERNPPLRRPNSRFPESQPSLQRRDSCGVGTIAGAQLLDGGREMIPNRTLGQV